VHICGTNLKCKDPSYKSKVEHHSRVVSSGRDDGWRSAAKERKGGHGVLLWISESGRRIEEQGG